VAKGHLVRIHRGVYAVGHTRLSYKGRWMSAVLAFGTEAAALSHGHAAALHDLRTVPSTAIDVTSPLRRKPKGVHAHWARTLDPLDTAMIDAITVTTVARTLLDEAEVLHPQRLTTLLEASLRRDLFDLNAIEATIARNPGRHGIKPLRQAVAALADEAPWTNSDKERHLLELVRAYGIPEPHVNSIVNGESVDFYWPGARLIVEFDGFDVHKIRRVFDDDRRKDAMQMMAGERVLRYTRRRVDHDRDAVAGEILTMLRRASAPAAASGP
jgi:very-short-patch-repair endonuclease